jgi:hypothetical protein
MKYFFLIFFSISTFSQEIKNDSIQLEWYNHANFCLSYNDNLSAYSSYKKAYDIDKKNDLGLVALRKIDSLNRIIKINLLKNISGKWEIVSSGSNWGISKEKVGLVTIKNSKVSFDFYDKSYSFKSSTIDLLLDDFLNYSFNEFVLEDNSLWSFSLKDEKLYISELGKKTDEGRSHKVCGNFFMECIKK